MSDDTPYRPRQDLLLRVREHAGRWGYDDPDEALEAALDLMDREPAWLTNADEAKMTRLREMIQVGVDDMEAGRVVDADDVFREMREERERFRRSAEIGAA